MNGWLFPFVFLAEQIGMGSCIQHYENKFLIVLFPNEKPVWLYVIALFGRHEACGAYIPQAKSRLVQVTSLPCEACPSGSLA